MADRKIYSFSAHPVEDADIVEILESLNKNERSEFIRQAIRHYAGILSQNSSKEELNQALLRVIQLEKRFNELVTEFNQFKELVYNDIESKFEDYERKLKAILDELEMIKQGYKRLLEEKKKKEEEEERRKNEEDEEIYKDLLERVYGVVVEMGVDKWIEEKGEHTLRARFERLLPVKAEEMGIKLDYNKAKAVLSKYYPEIAEILFGRKEGSRCLRF